jgi:transposase
MMARRRRFTATFQTQVVLDLLTGKHSRAHICRAYELKEPVVYRWKAEFLERADTIFGGDLDRQHAQERIADLERLVGQLTLELEIAKKASQLWTSRLRKNGS